MPREIAALARAVIVMRCPLDEFLRLLMHRAAGSNRVGAEALRLARSQPLKANRSRDVQKYHHVKKRNDRTSPAVERSTQHPVRPIEEHLAHQPETIGDLADLPVRRIRRKPEVVVSIVMRD